MIKVLKRANSLKALGNPLTDLHCPCCNRKLLQWIPNEATHLSIRCRRCKSEVSVIGGYVKVMEIIVDSLQRVM